MPYQLSRRADSAPDALDVEAQEAMERDHVARNQQFTTMMLAAEYEAESLRKLLAEWKGKR